MSNFLSKKWNFSQKSTFLLKINIFVKIKFFAINYCWPKILVKNRNLWPKKSVWLKIDFWILVKIIFGRFLSKKWNFDHFWSVIFRINCFRLDKFNFWSKNDFLYKSKYFHFNIFSFESFDYLYKKSWPWLADDCTNCTFIIVQISLKVNKNRNFSRKQKKGK